MGVLEKTAPLFSTLGRVVMTSGVSAEQDRDDDFRSFVSRSLARYMHKEWGELGADDTRLNNLAVDGGDDRILAAYDGTDRGSGQKKIWIITEWDRSVTTILFPEEY